MDTHPSRLTSPRYTFPDGLRGMAALWVVLFHLSEGHHIDTLRRMLPRVVVEVVFDWGDRGVAVFFVLSGFVMALTARRILFTGNVAARFVARRLVRLVPPYYVAVAISLAVLAVKSHSGQGVPPVSIGQLLAHAAFLQDVLGIRHLNPVYWTLCIEVQFYGAFALLMALADAMSRRGWRHARLACDLGMAIVVLAWPAGVLQTPGWPGSFLPYFALFMAGALVSQAGEAGARRWLGFAFAIGLTSLGVARSDPFAVTGGVTAAALGLATQAGAMGTWMSARPWQWLGSISYSLYLVHNPATGATNRLVARWLPAGGASAELLGAAASIAVSLMVAWALWAVVERPSIRASHRVSLAPAQDLTSFAPSQARS